MCSSIRRTPAMFSAAMRKARLSSSDWSAESQKCTTPPLTIMSAAQILNHSRALNHSCPISSAISWSRTVVAAGVDPRVALRYRQGPHEVCPAHNTDKPAIAEDRYALDPFCLEQHCHIGEFSRVGDRDNVTRHDVLCRAPMRLGIVAGEILVRLNRIEPPRAPPPSQTLRAPIGPGLNTMQEVALAHN